MKDPRSWLGAFAIIAPVLDIVVFGSFLPTFIHEFGFSPCKSSALFACLHGLMRLR